MHYYAKYDFIQNPVYPGSYLLLEKQGEVKNMTLARYTDSTKNQTLQIAGKEYVHFGVPRNESIKKYFAHTFEGFRGKPITSTEPLDDQNRTFGDTRQLGYKDLILIKFSEDMNHLTMWFVKDKGNTKYEKQEAFRNWCSGESLLVTA